MEVESGLEHDAWCMQPAYVLVPNMVFAKPAAFDLTVTSLLTPITLNEASVIIGSTAHATKETCQQ